MSMGGFAGLRVLSLESRRGREIAQLIRNQGGEPVVAPSVAEVPARQNDDVRRFVSSLRAGEIGLAIFTTGVGTRALAESTDCPRDEFVAGLQRIPVIARSNKPGAVLRELGIPIAATAPEPNTYLEVLALLDRDQERFPLRGQQVAIQEHGEISHELHAALVDRGAKVLPIVVYEWSMPEDAAPLRDAVERIARGDIDVVLFTATIQVRHLLEIAGQMKQREALLAGLARAVVCSIGPVTSAELRRHSIEIDVEPEHPRMGFLVAKAAADAPVTLARKRRDSRA
jgi:uroporphyrinogen-III synthase